MIGERIKAARKAKKLTQEQLAAKVKTTKGTISNYENGYSSPSNEMIVLLADVLEVSTDYLLGRIDNPEPLHDKKDKDEKEFHAFINDPELQVWYKELPKSDEEELRKLRAIWEMIKGENKKNK